MSVLQRRNPERATTRALAILAQCGIKDEVVAQRILQASISLPRANFVTEELRAYAEHDVALPIGFEQTSSKPSTIYKLIYLLDPQPGERILEIGAGCGYCLGLFSLLFSRSGRLQVLGVEKRVALATLARRNLDAVGLSKVLINCADGTLGWREHAPYDCILLSAAVTSISDVLLMQLSLGGRLVAPIITGRQTQRLRMWRRISTTSGLRADFELEDCGSCNFVLAI